MNAQTLKSLAIFLLMGAVCACSDDTRAPLVGGDAGADASADTGRADVGQPDASGDATGDAVGDASGDATGDADGCDESRDCDYDGLSDCRERELGTAVCNPDTDGDGLSDADEVGRGTDPMDEDTDQDGLGDAEEIDLGFDPLAADTYGDGVADGQRWIVGACDGASGEPLAFHTNSAANWRMALPSGFVDNPDLSIAGADASNHWAASVYADPANEVAGFLLSASPGAQQGPVEVLRDYQGRLGRLGVVEQNNTGGEFWTHDYRRAALGRYLLRLGHAASAEQARDKILFAIAPFDAAATGGLPEPSGADYELFRVFISTVVRTPAHQSPQVITSVAVAPADKYAMHEKVQFRLADLTNTTNLAETVDTHFTGCSRYVAQPDGQVDFYWVLDQSESMSDDYARVSAVASAFYDRLSNADLDFRLGVSAMDRDMHGRMRPGVGWHTDLSTFLGEVDYLRTWPGDRVSEYGLVGAKEGIIYMRGLGGQTPAPADAIRPDAQLVTVFMSDEEAQVIQDAPLTSTRGQQLLDDFIAFFSRQTLAFAIVAEGQAAGCGSSDGEAYRRVALASGGSFASVCDSDVSETIADIVFAASGQASSYVLPETPISSSLRVFVDGRWVPRSRQDGFDYFAEANAIAFFGSHRPSVGADGRAGRVAVAYEAFRDGSKE